MRLALSVVAGAAVAAFGALILGEYEFKGTMPYVAGPLFGLVVAEVVLAVARRATPPLAVAAAALSSAGLVWAAWISSGRDWDYVPSAAWAAVALGAAVALVRMLRSSGRPTTDSRPSP